MGLFDWGKQVGVRIWQEAQGGSAIHAGCAAPLEDPTLESVKRRAEAWLDLEVSEMPTRSRPRWISISSSAARRAVAADGRRRVWAFKKLSGIGARELAGNQPAGRRYGEAGRINRLIMGRF